MGSLDPANLSCSLILIVNTSSGCNFMDNVPCPRPQYRGANTLRTGWDQDYRDRDPKKTTPSLNAAEEVDKTSNE